MPVPLPHVPYRQLWDAAMTATELPHLDRYKRYRVLSQRLGGRTMTDAAPSRHRLRMLRKHGWGTYRAGKELGVASQTLDQIRDGKNKTVHIAFARAIEGLWLDVCGPVETDDRRWPVLPFKEAVIARYGSVRALGNTNQVRQIWRGGDISTRQAEDYAASLDLMPSDIWEDWYLR